jgi:hypothetical protein
MCRDVDPSTEAAVAMREAARAMCAVERTKWLRVALAWLDLARAETSRSAQDRTSMRETFASSRPQSDHPIHFNDQDARREHDRAPSYYDPQNSIFFVFPTIVGDTAQPDARWAVKRSWIQVHGHLNLGES